VQQDGKSGRFGGAVMKIPARGTVMGRAPLESYGYTSIRREGVW
jgi:hypothetical protein